MADEVPKTTLAMDESSTDTASAHNHYVKKYVGDEKEYVVKFVFRPKKNDTKVSSTHFAVLQVIRRVYPEVKIFNNNGGVITDLNRLLVLNDYVRHYNTQFLKGNEEKDQLPMYIVYHRLHSRIPISEIRNHHDVSARLKNVNARMLVHHWQENETRISNLGFFVEIDPSNVTEEEAVDRVQKEMVKQNPGLTVKKIPKFKMVFTSPFIYDDFDDKCNSKAYGLQCRQDDAKTLIKILKETYKKNPVFLFHRLRHQDEASKEIYRSALIHQNAYLKEHQVIPVVGLTDDIMFYLREKIMAIVGVTDVSKHRDTAKTGRFNVHTTRNYMNSVTKALRETIGDMVQTTLSEYSDLRLPSKFPKPGLAFKKGAYEDEEDDKNNSMETYISSCASMFSSTINQEYYKEEIDPGMYNPPSGSSPANQAWKCPVKIPAVVAVETRTDNTPSVMTVNEEREKRLIAENARQQKEIDALKEMVRKLQGRDNSSPDATMTEAVTNKASHEDAPKAMYSEQSSVTTPPVPPAPNLASTILHPDMIQQIASLVITAVETKLALPQQTPTSNLYNTTTNTEEREKQPKKLKESHQQPETNAQVREKVYSEATPSNNAERTIVDTSMLNQSHDASLDIGDVSAIDKSVNHGSL